MTYDTLDLKNTKFAEYMEFSEKADPFFLSA